MQIRHPKVALILLAGLHVLLGLTLNWTIYKYPSYLACFLGLAFSQCILLGIWAGLGLCRWPLRLIGFTLGTALVSIRFGGLPRFSFVASSGLAVTIVLLCVRWLVAQVQHRNEDGIPTSAGGLRFGTHHLLLLMGLASFICAFGYWLQPFRVQVTAGPDPRPHYTLISVVFVGLYVVVGLASTWAMLGGSHPFLRSAFVLLIAGGAFEVWAISLALRPSAQVRFALILAIEAFFLLASLFVVRLCGFRLVRRSRVLQQPKVAIDK